MAKKKLTAAEREKIKAQIEELQDALDDAEDATPEEQAAADAAVEEERQALAALFDKLGIGEDDYERLVAAVAAGAESRTREIVREELASTEGEEDDDEGTLAELQDDPESKTPPKKDEVPPETPPASQHWTEKKLFGRDKGATDGDQ